MKTNQTFNSYYLEMPAGGVDYNTRTKEQLIELIEMIQRDRYRIEQENRKLKDIINKIFYLYNEEPTELEEYVKSGFKGGMSNC